MITYIAVFFILLSIVLSTAVVFLWRRIHLHEKQMAELQEEKAQEHSDSIHLHNLQEMLWQAVNTIHLLAALSEEESSSEEIKDKQRMILTECEKIEQQL